MKSKADVVRDIRKLSTELSRLQATEAKGKSKTALKRKRNEGNMFSEQKVLRYLRHLGVRLSGAPKAHESVDKPKRGGKKRPTSVEK